MNILLTSAGRRVSLLRCLQRDLKSRSPQGKVFATDLLPSRSAACQVADASFQVQRVTSSTYPDELLKLCQENDIGMVVPTIDTELLMLAEQKTRFATEGIHLVVSDLSLIQACRDKRLTHKIFFEYGIKSAEIFHPDAPEYPCFAKPVDGSCSVGLHLIQSENDWPENVRYNPNYMICEYVRPNLYAEYTIDMYFSQAGQLISVVPRKRLEVRGGEVSKGITVKHELITHVKEKLGNLKGARGCITLQVFAHNDTDEIIGIEINPRFGGGFPLTDQAGGRYTDWLIGEIFDQTAPEPFENWTNGLVMLRYDHEIFTHETPS